MNRVLRKRLLRDLKSNFLRYLALFLLIVMGMYVVVSIVGAADTIIVGSADKAEENCVEDGQFGVFLPLTDAQEKELTDTGIQLEKMFSMDMEAEDGSIVRLMKNRGIINLIDLDEGHLAENSREIAMEKRYCQEHGLKTGDNITISGLEFVIVGIGCTPDYDMPTQTFSDMAVESNRFGTAFVTEKQYEEMKEYILSKAEDYRYAYRLNDSGMTDDEVKRMIKEFDFDYAEVKDVYFQELIADTMGKKSDLQDGMQKLSESAGNLTDGLQELCDHGKQLKQMIPGMDTYVDGVEGAYDGSVELSNGIAALKTETDELLDEYFDIEIDNLTSFVKKADNPRILAAAGDAQINREAGLFAGVIIMVLFAYVISVFVIHQIQQESSVIGVLYALGAKKKDLLIHYITLPTLLTFFGGVTGALLGFSKVGIPTQTANSCNYFSIPNPQVNYPAYLIIYTIVIWIGCVCEYRQYAGIVWSGRRLL